MSISEEDLAERIKNYVAKWARELGLASAVANALTGFGISGRLIQYGTPGTAQSSTMRKISAGIVTIDAASDATVTITGDVSIPQATYSDEQAQDAIGGILTDTATIDATYNDGTPSITHDVKSDSITNALLANMAAWSIKLRNAGSSGDPSDAAVGDLTEEASPAAGDFVVGYLASGEIRKFDVDNIAGLGGTGDWIRVSESTASNSASLPFTGLDGTYRKYKFEIRNLKPATDNTALHFQVSTDGGSTWLSTGYSYHVSLPVDSSGSYSSLQSASDSKIQLTSAAGNAADESLNGDLTIHNHTDTANQKMFTGLMAYKNINGATQGATLYGANTTTSAINAARFVSSSGNIASGTITLYGEV